MARPQTKLPPTPHQRRLLKIAVELDGSIAAFAHRAGVSEPTVRRYLFDERRASRAEWDVVGKLVAAGWPAKFYEI